MEKLKERKKDIASEEDEKKREEMLKLAENLKLNKASMFGNSSRFISCQ